MSPISTRRHGDILVVTSNNPPVNALGHAVREGLVAAIAEADGDEAVKAVVIVCQGQTFFAGADITEFGKPMQMPMLPQVVDIIENCTKPVVAAIHGTAFGGGLEVALASHYRVALPSAKLGVPEVKLGLLPGAGGTQRLPRAAGVRKALEMAATGNPISAKEAVEVGLVDRLIEGDLEQHAVAFADEVKAVRPIPKTSARDDKLAEARSNPAVFDEFRKENARKFKGFDAPEQNIKAIEAAVAKPYAEGVQDERRLFMELMSGTQARAQQYFFFAERQAAKIDGLPEGTTPRAIERVGVIGAGTMGGGISMNFLSAGIPVTIVEMQQDALDRGTGVMRRNYEASAAKGRITAAQAEGAMGLLEADAQPRRPRRLRPHHRGRVREYGRQEGGVRQARQDRQTGRDPRLQHLLPQRRRDRGEHLAAAGRRRPPLLLARQHHEIAGSGPRRQNRARRPDDGDAARQANPQGRGGGGRLLRLHRQPDADAAPGPGQPPAPRRRHARADRPGPCRVRNADGPVPDGRSGRGRHRLAPRSGPRRERPRRPLRRRPLGPEEGRRLLRL